MTQSKLRKGLRLPFKIVDSYLFSHVAEATLRSIIWFVGLLMMVVVLSALRKLADKSLMTGGLIEFIAYQMPRMVLMTLPMSLLYGTVQTFTDLSGRGEVTALFAGGMSLRRMLAAPLGFGAVLAVIAFLDQEILVPLCEQKRDNALAQSLMKNLSAQVHFRYEEPPSGSGPLKRVIQADRFDAKTGVMVNPVIQLFGDNQRLKFELAAERAQWDLKSGKWFFYNGETSVFRGDRQDTSFVQSRFSKMYREAPEPRLMSNATKTWRQHIENRDFEFASISDLLRFREEVRDELRKAKDSTEAAAKQHTIKSITYGIHDKIVSPLICVILILVGVPLGIRPQRSTGNGVAMGLSLAVLVVYYLVYMWTRTLGSNNAFHPVLMAYLAPMLAAIIGMILVWKKER